MKQKPPSSGAAASPSPQDQTCGKCGAVFRWQPSDPTVKASPLQANLVKAGEKCDCGYGAMAPVFEN